jgi:YD repeat-containing protein
MGRAAQKNEHGIAVGAFFDDALAAAELIEVGLFDESVDLRSGETLEERFATQNRARFLQPFAKRLCAAPLQLQRADRKFDYEYDVLGQVTTISYELSADPLKITKVTEPFGRVARFEYNANWQLWKITDSIGLVSQFTYGTGISSTNSPLRTATPNSI